MARQFTLATSDIAYAPNFSLVGTADWVMSAFLYRTDNTQANALLYEFGSGAVAGFDIVANTALNGGGTDQIRSYGTVAQWADTYVAPAAGAWHHYVWVIAGNGPPSPNSINIVYIDGVLQTLTTVGHTYPNSGATTQDFTFMGRRSGGVNSRFLSGRLAEWAMWSSPTMRANPAPYVKQLAAGCCPLIINKREMIMYVPYFGVDSPEPDIHGNQRNLTLNGTPSRINHPPKARSMVNFQY